MIAARRLPTLNPASTRAEIDARDRAAAMREREQAAKKCLNELFAKIGRRYHACRFANFTTTIPGQTECLDAMRQYARDLPDRVDRGQDVILFGPPGTGKDHLMCALIWVAVAQHHRIVRWVNGLDLFGDMRDRIESERTERDLIAELARADILAISDPLPPSGALTSYQQSMMLRIIDRRYRDMRPTWVTINVASSAECAERLGSASVDRLRDSAVYFHCNWPSYRARKR